MTTNNRKKPEKNGFTRRSLLKASALGAVAGFTGTARAQRPSVAVVGAGAFGGWTALELLRRGARVTLVDAWGPGNSRASSGGETRVIRGTYGDEEIYVRMVARALTLWQENEKKWNRRLFRRRGVLWLVGDEDDLEKSSLPLLREVGIPFEELGTDELEKRYPQIDFEGVRWGIYEPDSGYLTARAACGVVLEGFLAEGGEFRQATVAPGSIRSGKMNALSLSDGSSYSADRYVFACGPWLGRLFPDVIGDRIRPTRQEVFYFGTPTGDLRYSEGHVPVWIDNGERLYYGIPGSDRRGFKVADDSRGPLFDPTSGERTPSPESLEAARNYVTFRFPGMKDAPLLESRVCTYENTIDQDFIVDRHPNADNAWLVGGGSGHGFKHGPAMGELVAEQVLGTRKPEPKFRLSRL